jgi:response regulator of citrate/malate metabolism
VIGSPIGSSVDAQPGKVTFTALGGKLTLADVYLPTGAGFSLATHTASR